MSFTPPHGGTCPCDGCNPDMPEEATVYATPNTISCPTCKAQPNEPCYRLNGGGMMMGGWHYAREHRRTER